MPSPTPTGSRTHPGPKGLHRGGHGFESSLCHLASVWALCCADLSGHIPTCKKSRHPPPPEADRSPEHEPSPAAPGIPQEHLRRARARPLLAPVVADPRLFSCPQCHRVTYHLDLHVVMFTSIKFSFAFFCVHRQFSQQTKETESVILSILGSEVVESEPPGGLAFSPRSPSLRAPHRILSLPLSHLVGLLALGLLGAV